MNRIETPLVFEGPAGLLQGVEYLHGEPEIGMVAVRHLFDDEQIAAIVTASQEPFELEAGNIPNGLTALVEIREGLKAGGINLPEVDMLNLQNWGGDGVFHPASGAFGFTQYGRSFIPHADKINGAWPIGVSASISIGRATFGAGLPPEELRTAGEGYGVAAQKWATSPVAGTETIYTAELEAGDAALWLQPGLHESFTTDPNRFACLYITKVKQ